MLKAAILFAFTVAFNAVASPAPGPAAPGTVIPLTRRSSLTGADGVFDNDKATSAIIDTINKHLQNMANFQKNIGGNVSIRVPVPLPADVEDRLLKRQSEALTDESNDLERAGTISVGTPKQGTANQNFLIDFNTGSADLWIPSLSCTSSACRNKSKYNPNSSSTSSKKTGTLLLEYADGSTISGPVYSDTVTVAGVTVKNQYFSAVTTLSSDFTTDPVDGIMGMGLLPISGLRQDPFLMNAESQGAVSVGQFSFYLASTGSELYLGGTDTKKYTGAIEFNPINTATGYWDPMNAQAKVGSATVLTGLQTIIDSGSTLMVPGAKIFESGYYSYPCASPPRFHWTVSAANLNLGLTKAKSTDCVASLVALDVEGLPNTCILGDAFMRNFYSVFDLDRKAVGFASLV
ncbi:acid protease [Mycena metata]|uniref:Acid protease n=1 Tax=Mycena metata TaxID=1033252 RepID=A0AAD7H595_9AGAR|nr:acid protease [Mycena metata]